MIILSQIALLLSLGGVVWQDFKDRWISIGLFLFIGILGVLALNNGTAVITGADIMGNISFITLIFCCLAIYSRLRFGSFLGFVDTAFGKGDMVFIGLLTLLLPFESFLLFFVGSITIILLGVIIYSTIRTSEKIKIPLAGGQALFLMIHYILEWGMDINLLSISYML